MERKYVQDVLKGKEEEVLVRGWVYDMRDLGKIKFFLLRDISGIIQVTSKDEKMNKEINKLAREFAVSVTGSARKSKQAPGGMEIFPEKIEVIAKAEHPLPIDVSDFSKTGLDKRLDWRCLSLRTKKSQAIFKIQGKLIEGMQEWLNKNNFYQVFTPCIMGVPSESGSEVFEIKYYKGKAFLRQDPQLHRQLAIAGGIEKLYDIGPSWRAEKSHTVKHLCEHRTCAVELAFIESEQDTMRVEEQVIISAFEKVNEECKEELKELGVELKIPKAPFPELRFPEVYQILDKMGKKIKVGEDLDAEAEKLLWKHIQKKYPGAEFYFLNKFPFKIKPFYVRKEDDSEYARSVDLYYQGMEMSSGGQRENRYDRLMESVKVKKLNPKSVEWFTKFFKYGVPPHGGFALGIERLTMILLGIENIREAVLFPRDPERNTP
ncbi:MAG: aspartate--tRNA(Asn) ligase [archaeon]